MASAAVFGVTCIGVVDGHQDELLHFSGPAKLIRRPVQVPTAPAKADVGPGRTEDVLPIVEIKHGILTIGLRVV